MMRPGLPLLAPVVGMILYVAPAIAFAEQLPYQGQHPIPENRAGSFCYIGVPHAHSYRPEEASQSEFRRTQRGLEFVGDPTAHRYEGPSFAYKGHHPLHFDGSSDLDSGSCEEEGEHFHLLAPANVDDYEEQEGSFVHKEALAELEESRSSRRRSKKSKRHRKKKKRSRRSRNSSLFDSPVPTKKQSSADERASEGGSDRKQAFRSWMDRRRGR